MTKDIIKQSDIENRIFTVRGLQVMLDSHIAELYGVTTSRLNEQVQRNLNRFPSEFMFRLTDAEFESLRSQIATLNELSLRSQNATLKNKRGLHRKYLPFVFTEQGVAMLSAVLRSDMAVKVSIQVIHAFVEMRKFIADKALVFQRLDKVEHKQIETDEKFEKVFKALESRENMPDKGIFFDGQVFDAYAFIAGIVRKAKSSIILIDNYIDDTVLTLFSKRKKGVSLTIYTKEINKQLDLDVKKHNAQYDPITLKVLKQTHDRFLIIDESELYHIGASLKDLGKKWFAFSKMDKETIKFLEKLSGIK